MAFGEIKLISECFDLRVVGGESLSAATYQAIVDEGVNQSALIAGGSGA